MDEKDAIADADWSKGLAERIKPSLQELIDAKAKPLPDPVPETPVVPETEPKIGSREWIEAKTEAMSYTAVRKRDILERRQRIQEEKRQRSQMMETIVVRQPPVPLSTSSSLSREHRLDALVRRLADQHVSMVRDRVTILQSWLDRGEDNQILFNHIVEIWRAEEAITIISVPPPKRRGWFRRSK